MIEKPVKVPQAKISSVDVTSFGGGLFTLGAEIAPKDTMVSSKDVEVNSRGFIEPRRTLGKFLPDTVETTYQKYPVIWEGEIYYFTMDDGEVRFCTLTDTSWTSCGGTNSFTTGAGGRPTFLRVLDKVLIINGVNGDRLAFVDLTSVTFDVTKYTLVTNPSNAPTIASSVTVSYSTIGTYSNKLYYAMSWNGPIGQTELSPILSMDASLSRDSWAAQGTPASILFNRNNSIPSGATTWNIYIALAAPTGTIQKEDMLLLVSGIDQNTTTFRDDGTLAINLSQTAPTQNSTEGPLVEHGIIANGRPVLYGDQESPYRIWIGGGGIYALDFTVNNGGFMSEPEKGTNFFPSAIIGFRTGQGQPALTVMYSNVEGLSKQSVLQEQTVNYGDISFTVWGVVEQNYGAAGVAAPYSPVNYNGKLGYLSTDGMMFMETEATMQNVLSINHISDPISDYIRTIKTSAMAGVVGCGWEDKFMWIVPNGGFDTPQQILVLDTKNKGVEGNGAWYTLDIEADWIGVITPNNTNSFVYLSQGNKSYILNPLNATYDVIDGVNVPFTTQAVGAMMGMAGDAHNSWQANVQVMFYVMNVLGEVEVGVNFRNQTGTLKTKSKTIEGNAFTPSSAGGWGDVSYTYSDFPLPPGYIYGVAVSDENAVFNPSFRRVAISIDDIINEGQWYIRSSAGFNRWMLRSVSFEGIGLGVLPDLT